MNEQIVILDFGSQYTQVIARRIRECNVYSVILALRHAGGGNRRAGARGHHFVRRPVQRVCEKCAVAGQEHFRARRARARHLLRRAIVRAVSRRQGRERPQTRIRQRTVHVKDASCPLFRNLPESLQVWNSHGDKLTKLPRDFKPVAVTENSEYAAIENRARKFFGLQFHPEVVHTPRGREIIANFVHGDLRLRQKLDDAELRRAGRRGNPRAGRGRKR